MPSVPGSDCQVNECCFDEQDGFDSFAWQAIIPVAIGDKERMFVAFITTADLNIS